MNIKGCVAIVSGGNRGIGEAFVLELLEAGAKHVYVGSRDPQNAKALQEKEPERISVLSLDMADEKQIKAAAEQCSDVNLVVNNAGVFNKLSLMNAPDLSAMRNEMEVNYLGPVAMARAFAPIIEQNGGGCILNVLSAGGIVSVPEMGGYSPSKFAARAASNCLRAELAPRGIHVSSLIVGSVKTRMAEHVKGVAQVEPAVIAKAGILAAKAEIDEHDTDLHAIGVRAALARDPAGLAKALAAGVGAA